MKTLDPELGPDLDPNLNMDPDSQLEKCWFWICIKSMRIHNPVQITSELK
jgi:hypothetical protein